MHSRYLYMIKIIMVWTGFFIVLNFIKSRRGSPLSGARGVREVSAASNGDGIGPMT